MRVLHLSSSDIDGGAARAAYRLHAGLKTIGIDSRMLVIKRRSDDPTVQKYPVPNSFSAKASRKLWRHWQGPWASPHRPLGHQSLEIFSTDRSQFGSSVLESISDVDIVNLHWVSGMFDWSALASLARRSALVWTLHDMNPITGGCHFDDGCGRFQDACGQCPQLASHSSGDRSSSILRRKMAGTQGIPSDRLNVVAPSRWLAGEASKSRVLGRFPSGVIPYGLETDVFQPRDPAVIRTLLDIPLTAPVVLFVADGLQNRRKGFDFLIKALQNLGEIPDLHLVAVGGGFNAKDFNLPVPVRVVPRVTDDRYLSFVYSAADLFVMASRADNLPNTVLESLSCGVPVVGFDCGGVPDMVIPEQTGLLATAGDVEALASAMKRILTETSLRSRMKLECRQLALQNFPLETQARRYMQVYRSLLGQVDSGHQERQPAGLSAVKV